MYTEYSDEKVYNSFEKPLNARKKLILYYPTHTQIRAQIQWAMSDS